MQFQRSKIQLSASEALRLCKRNPGLAKQLKYEWDLWALDHQRDPGPEYPVSIHIGGRGSGKTFGQAQAVREAVCRGVKRINFVGRTAKSVREVMVTGETGIIAVFPRHQKPEFISSQSLVRFHTGAEAFLHTSEEPMSIQGNNSEYTWIDEFSTFGRNAEAVWTQVNYANRVGSNPLIRITTNSMPECDFLKELITHASSNGVHVRRSDSRDNFSNLPKNQQAYILEQIKTPMGLAWVTGQFFVSPGALWKPGAHPDQGGTGSFKYLPDAPRGGTVCIGVDPSGGSTDKNSDETGIIVAKRIGNNGYVIADLSGHHDAEVWPKMVADAVRKYGAQWIVIEKNRGLNYLRACIRPHHKTVELREETVTKQKDDRAYPIANLYALGKIFHCPAMTTLEKQMCSWDPKSQETQRARHQATSPDRIDAAVHALASLGIPNIFSLPSLKALDGPIFPTSY